MAEHLSQESISLLERIKELLLKTNDPDSLEQCRSELERVITNHPIGQEANLFSPQDSQGDASNLDLVNTLHTGINNKQVVRIQYRTGYSKEYTERDIECHALYYADNIWIVIAWCRLRDDYREFRLDRILSMSIREENFDARDFDLMKYFYSILSP